MAHSIPHYKGGRIIFFSSTLTSFSGVPPHALLYCATKGAIEQINRVLAKELGPKGITVNTVAPGPIDTDMFMAGKTEQQIEFFKSIHPQKRIGLPEEVAPLVAFLASSGSSWINGQTIRVNGVSLFVYYGLFNGEKLTIGLRAGVHGLNVLKKGMSRG